MPSTPPISFDPRDVFFITPQVVLAVWGLVVLLADLALARRLAETARRQVVGKLALVGVGLALAAALAVMLVPLFARAFPEDASAWFRRRTLDYLFENDPTIFLGTIAGDLETGTFNLVFVLLLGLVTWLSLAWKFTEEWGEYLALLFWATVGMMFLSAAEEFITLFVALETMTICLYLATSLEKARRRSAEGGLKYFVYGSVSSALFLFGLSYLYGITGTTQFNAIHGLLAGAGESGLAGNPAGMMAILLILAGFGFKIAAVPFHQWAPDVYEGAPAPVAAWVATGSKIASFVAFMKVFANALLPWASPGGNILGPGWIGVLALIAAVTMTYGNFAALAQRNLKRMLAYSSIAHSGYILVGVAALGLSTDGARAAGAVLFYLVVYSFANVGAFAAAAWLMRDRENDNIDDLSGLAREQPLLAVCILFLMLSLIGIPPLAGFFGKLYVFMEALNQPSGSPHAVTLIWLVALGLFNSVVSAFYYVRVLRAMFLRDATGRRLAPADTPVGLSILAATAVVIVFGPFSDSLMSVMQAAAAPMLTVPATVPPLDAPRPRPGKVVRKPVPRFEYSKEEMERMRSMANGGAGPPGGVRPAAKSAGPSAKAKNAPASKTENAPASKANNAPASKGALGDSTRTPGQN